MNSAGIIWECRDPEIGNIPDDLKAFAGFELVNKSDARILLRGLLGGKQCYVKLYLNPTVIDFLRYCFKKNKSLKEYENGVLLSKKGIRVPRSLAAGTFSSRDMKDGGIFISEEVAGARTLSEEIRKAPDTLMDKFCGFVRELHKKGIYQADFHLDNILVSGAQMYLIDVQRVKCFDSEVPARLISRNLANINMFLRENLGRKYQLMFFEGYFGADFRVFFEDIERMSDEYFYRLWKRRDKKAVENKENYSLTRVKGMKCVALKKFSEYVGADFVPDIEKLFAAAEVIKDDIKTSVRRVDYRECDLVIKRYNRTSVFSFPGVKALNSWKGSVGLKIRKISTPEALMSVSGNGAGYFIAENKKDIVRIDEFLRQEGLSREEKRKAMENTGKFFADMHNKGIYHRDTKPGNIFIERKCMAVSILDTDRVQFSRALNTQKKVKNLKRLIDNIGDTLKREYKDIFLKSYFAEIRSLPARYKREAGEI
ncbi:MAG: hypothetical protein JW728_00390 [Candidatus Aureabacteria bacterium]|nr:hypothetical protein [Candidatus Auribacterota bacterium]